METEKFPEFVADFLLDSRKIFDEEEPKLAVGHHFLEVDEGGSQIAHMHDYWRRHHVHTLHVSDLRIVDSVQSQHLPEGLNVIVLLHFRLNQVYLSLSQCPRRECPAYIFFDLSSSLRGKLSTAFPEKVQILDFFLVEEYAPDPFTLHLTSLFEAAHTISPRSVHPIHHGALRAWLANELLVFQVIFRRDLLDRGKRGQRDK